MIECLISWGIILVSAYLWGSVSLEKLTKISERLSSSCNPEKTHWRTDDCIIAGMCMLTVYAQAFSIFYKVGAVALLAVLAADIVFFLQLKKRMLFKLRQIFSHADRIKTLKMVIICTIIGIVVLRATALPASHYDSALYHAQSIRWIEEYGVVKGLGNLHNRLAYNSAFFCLQALFSFSFLAGKSLHTVNGLIVTVFLCYAVCSAKIWSKKGAAVSDFIRLAFIAYFLSEISVWSSPGSDLLAIGLVLYIICKWQSYLENKEKGLLLYTELCFLAVWAVSVKLSAAVMVILVIYPAVNLLRNKEWKQIVMYIFAGIGIICPFLVRNVIISGYMIYPYPELDLFGVDWKMPAYTLLFDRNEITAWGRGLKDVFRFDEPIKVWFPIWYESLGSLKKWWWMAVIGGGIVGIKSLCMMIWSVRNYATDYFKVEDALKHIAMVSAMTGCMLLWFIGSPLPRYGGGYLYMISLFFIGEVVVFIQDKLRFCWMNPACFAFVLGLLAASCCSAGDVHLLRVPDYNVFGFDVVEIEQHSFYVPNGGDQIGYSAFPSTPYRQKLDEIELRGNTLHDGFRMKEEYRDAYVSTYGAVYDNNIFE